MFVGFFTDKNKTPKEIETDDERVLKNRQNLIMLILIWTSVIGQNNQQAEAKNTVDGFQPVQPTRNQPAKNSGLFNDNNTHGHSSNPNESGNDKGNDNGNNGGGLPECSAPESIEQTEKRVENVVEYLDRLKKKEKEETKFEDIVDQLPKFPLDSNFEYSFKGSSSKTALKNLWKDEKAQKQLLEGLEKVTAGDFSLIERKKLQGFKTVREIKWKSVRALVYIEKGKKDSIIAITHRRDMEPILKNFRSTYK